MTKPKKKPCNYTPRPQSSGTLTMTPGQVARWFIETYKAEFDDSASPLYGQSTEVWQSCVNYLEKEVWPDQTDPEQKLASQILSIFIQEWLPLFQPIAIR